MTPFVDLGPAANRFAALLPAVTHERLGSPTPCPGTTVADLVSHVIGLSAAFRAGAEKAPDAGPPPDELPALAADWRTALPASFDALVAAWRVPAARDGTTSVGGVEMPAAMVAVVALDELVLHGWDLARATGQPYDVDQVGIDACLGFVAAAARPEGVPGLFGPAVPVPREAPALHRLVGLSGRDPGWIPSPLGGPPGPTAGYPADL